jgi:hypothetical protein
MSLSRQYFSQIDLADPFFDSLKADYSEFPDWFKKKATDKAYVFKGSSGLIDGFLYFKIEDGELRDVDPPLPAAKRLKIGTLKINPHGTRLGERFIKKVIDHALAESVDEAYVTVFEKHAALVSILERYGFHKLGKKTTANGTELVLVKKIFSNAEEALDRYPVVKLGANSIYLLSLHPIWHTRLLPDSILNSEDSSVVTDVSHTNSMHKVYLANMRGMESIKAGDILLIYRTTDNLGPAHFRSVVTSVCVVEEYSHINTFANKDSFVRYCEPYSVFQHEELEDFWRTKKYPHVLRFTYNFALPKRITRGNLIENFDFDAGAYWGFMNITNTQLQAVLAASGLNENLVIN